MDSSPAWSPPGAVPPPDSFLVERHLPRVEGALRAWRALSLIVLSLLSFTAMLLGVQFFEELPWAIPKLVYGGLIAAPLLVVFIGGRHGPVWSRVLTAATVTAIMSACAWCAGCNLFLATGAGGRHGAQIVGSSVYLGFFAFVAGSQGHRFWLELRRWRLLMYAGKWAPPPAHPPPVAWWWRALVSLPAPGAVVALRLYYQDDIRFWTADFRGVVQAGMILPAAVILFLVWWPNAKGRLIAAGATLAVTVYGGIALYLLILYQWSDDWRLVRAGTFYLWLSMWAVMLCAWLWAGLVCLWARREFQHMPLPALPAPIRTVHNETDIPDDAAGWDQSQPQK